MKINAPRDGNPKGAHKINHLNDSRELEKKQGEKR